MRRPDDRAFEYLLENLESHAGTQTGRFVYNEFLELLKERFVSEVNETYWMKFLRRQRVE